MKKYSFLEELLIQGNINHHCSSIDIEPYIQRNYSSSDSSESTIGKQARSYWDVPDYMKISFQGGKKKNFEKTVTLYESSYIELRKYQNFDHFLKQKLSSNRRAKIRASKRNLELIFPIGYACYYGEEIPRTRYSVLMNSLKEMISKRFEEKMMEHTALEDWGNFVKWGRKLIMEKRAAMFVIYSDGRPVHISFTYVWEKVVFPYVRGYDMDYSRFHLGFIDMLIQIEWCFSNQFKICDLLRGNLDYKMLFADSAYMYRAHYILPSLARNPLSFLPWIWCSLKFDVYYTFRRKLGVLYNNIPYVPKKEKKKIIYYQMTEPTEEEVKQLMNNQLIEIPIDPEPRENLKRAAYHFLYNSKTPLKELRVYVKPERSDVFFLKGSGQLKKVSFTNTEKIQGNS